MKAVLQRVKSASVSVDGKLISQIGKGILVFAAVGKDDTEKEAESMAGKVLKFKIWDDDEGGRWKQSVTDVEGEILCVSQFTLYASTKKGNKPDFHKSAGGDKARELYMTFYKNVQKLYKPERVKDGVFQAMMDVALVNDGPVGDDKDADDDDDEDDDYSSSEDEEANGPIPVGLDYRSEDGVVTLEINTDPPKSNIPGNPPTGEAFSFDNLGEGLQKVQTEFQIPAELLR